MPRKAALNTPGVRSRCSMTVTLSGKRTADALLVSTETWCSVCASAFVVAQPICPVGPSSRMRICYLPADRTIGLQGCDCMRGAHYFGLSKSANGSHDGRRVDRRLVSGTCRGSLPELDGPRSGPALARDRSVGAEAAELIGGTGCAKVAGALIPAACLGAVGRDAQ